MEMLMNDELRKFFMTQRKTLLEQVDALERLLGLSPRTAEIRKAAYTPEPPAQYEVELQHMKESEVSHGT